MFVFGAVTQVVRKAEPEEVEDSQNSEEAAPVPIKDPPQPPQPLLQIGIICLIVFTIILDLILIIGNLTLELKDPFILAGVVGIASAILLGVGVKKKSVIVVQVAFGGYIFTLGLILICLGAWVLFTIFPPDNLRKLKMVRQMFNGTTTTTTIRPNNGSTTKLPRITIKPELVLVDWKSWTFIFPITLVFVVAVVYVYMSVVIYFYVKRLSAPKGVGVVQGPPTDQIPVKEEDDDEEEEDDVSQESSDRPKIGDAGQ